MGDTKWLPSALFVLAAAILGAGALYYFSHSQPAPTGNPGVGETPTVAPLTAETTGRPDAGRADARASQLRTELDQVRGELEVKKRREAEMEKRIAWLEGELEKLRGQLRVGDLAKSERVSRILAALEKIKKEGLASMLDPAAIAQLSSDLREMGPQGLGPLLDLLATGDPNAKILAAKLLEDLGDPRAVPALTEAARSDDIRVASMASHALAFLKSPEAQSTLLELSEGSKHEGVRLNSIYGLCVLGDTRGFERALAYVQDPGSKGEYIGALAPGIFAMTNPQSWGVGRVLADRFGAHEVLGPLAISYLRGLGTPDAMNLLQTWSTDSTRSQALRDAALAALSS